MAHMEDQQRGRKVLLAVDGSDNSEEAFRKYATMIWRPKDLVLIVYVQDERPVAPYPRSSIYYDQWVGIVNSMKEQAAYITSYYETKCQDCGLHFEPVMIEAGKPGEVICRVAEEEEVDIIIVGSRGQGTIRRTLMGSVSSHCVHHAHVPVLVVPHVDRHIHHGVDNC